MSRQGFGGQVKFLAHGGSQKSSGALNPGVNRGMFEAQGVEFVRIVLDSGVII